MKATRLGLAALALAAGLSAATAADKATMVINLTSDDVWTAQMALNYARTLQDAGAPVVVFLNVRGATLGNTAVPQHVEAGTGKTAHQMIEAIVAAGGRVFLCGGCTRMAGLDAEKRLPGVEMAGPDLVAIMTDPSTNILSY